MKGSLLHNGVVSYGKTFVALTRCLQIQLSTTNLVKDMHTRKVQRKSPLMHSYLYASGGLLTITCEGRDSIEPYSVGVSLVGELTVRELLRLILSPLKKCHVTLSLRRLRGDKSVRSSSAKSVLMRMTALL